MRALSIRQPYAELILREIKTAELRSRATTIVGERFFIYASKKKGSVADGLLDMARGRQWPVKKADNIVVPTEPLPAWMIELAEQVKMIEPDAILPTGVIVGSAVIERCEEVARGLLKWHLTDVQRAKHLRKPRQHPQPVWFNPF